MAEIGAGGGSGFPGALDTNATVEVDAPASGKTKARADVPNDLAAAIIATQTELGTDPAGTLTDVKTFLQTEHETDGTHWSLLSKSSAYTVVAGDIWNNIVCDTSSAGFTLTLTAAATLGDSFIFAATNTGANTLTIDANGSETIGGSTTVTLSQNQSGIYLCDGTNWHTLAGAADAISPLTADLDVGSSSIISSSDGDIAITPNGTGDVIIDGLKYPQADGTSGQHLSTDGAGQLSWASESMVQIVSTQTGAVATGTTVIPQDDTIPQNTEGTEFLSLAITPTSASNKLLIIADVCGGSGMSSGNAAALFQDSTAGALAVMAHTRPDTSNPFSITLMHTMTAGTTSSTTFKIRAGGNGAGTFTFNGKSSARQYGGVYASGIRIIEYTP